jgi:hypothetical protein
LDAPCDPAEERPVCLFPTAHRLSFFSSLSPQEFVDLSNQMYTDIAVKGESIIRFLPIVLLEKPASFS